MLVVVVEVAGKSRFLRFLGLSSTDFSVPSVAEVVDDTTGAGVASAGFEVVVSA